MLCVVCFYSQRDTMWFLFLVNAMLFYAFKQNQFYMNFCMLLNQSFILIPTLTRSILPCYMVMMFPSNNSGIHYVHSLHFESDRISAD